MRCSLLAGVVAAAGIVAAAPKNKAHSTSSSLACTPSTVTTTSISKTTKTVTISHTITAPAQTVTAEITLPPVTITKSAAPTTVFTTVVSTVYAAPSSGGTHTSSTTSTTHTTTIVSSSASTSNTPTSTTQTCPLAAETFAIAIASTQDLGTPLGYIALAPKVETNAEPPQAYNVAVTTGDLSSAQLFTWTYNSYFSVLEAVLPSDAGMFPGLVSYPNSANYTSNWSNSSQLMTFLPDPNYDNDYDRFANELEFDLNADCSFTVWDWDGALTSTVTVQLEEDNNYITFTQGTATEGILETVSMYIVLAPDEGF